MTTYYYYNKYTVLNYYNSVNTGSSTTDVGTYGETGYTSYTFDSTTGLYYFNGNETTSGGSIYGTTLYVPNQTMGSVQTSKGIGYKGMIVYSYEPSVGDGHIWGMSYYNSQPATKPGTLLASNVVLDQTYPSNGIAPDGYWYVRGSAVQPLFLFQDGDRIKWYQQNMIYSEDKVPALTSNNSAPPGRAFSSSDRDIDSQAWKAFDRNISDGTNNYSWVSANGQATGYVGYDWGSRLWAVQQYAITAPLQSGLDCAPKSWTFEGSNDGLSWTVLQTQLNAPAWSLGERRVYTTNNITTYQMYRLNISVNQGNIYYVAVCELEMMVPYVGWCDLGPAPATPDMFSSRGMTSLTGLNSSQIFAPLQTLKPQLLMWTPYQGAHTTNLVGVPNPKIVLGTVDINLTNFSLIHAITSVTSISGNASIAFIVSVDRGETWWAYITSGLTPGWTQVDATNIHDVLAKAMVPSTMASLMSTDWTALAGATPTIIRFGVYLDQMKSTDVEKVTSISVLGDLNLQWAKAVLGTDYNYAYNSPTNLHVILMSNGSFKINYLNY